MSFRCETLQALKLQRFREQFCKRVKRLWQELYCFSCYARSRSEISTLDVSIAYKNLFIMRRLVKNFGGTSHQLLSRILDNERDHVSNLSRLLKRGSRFVFGSSFLDWFLRSSASYKWSCKKRLRVILVWNLVGRNVFEKWFEMRELVLLAMIVGYASAASVELKSELANG